MSGTKCGHNRKCRLSICDCESKDCELYQTTQKSVESWKTFISEYDPMTELTSNNFFLCKCHFSNDDKENPFIAKKNVKNYVKQLRELKLKNQELMSVFKDKLQFGDDQIQRVVNNVDARFSEKTLMESIGAYAKCGETAYEHFRSKGYPIPCIRTLQYHMSSIKLGEGINDFLIQSLAARSEKDWEVDGRYVLISDATAIAPGLVYDPNLKMLVGATHEMFSKDPESVKLAKKIQLYLMKSIKTGRMQILAYYFVSEIDGKQLLEARNKLIMEIEGKTRYKIVGSTTDSEPNNLACARESGVWVDKENRVFDSKHPLDIDKPFAIFTDCTHNLKSLHRLVQAYTVELPNSIVSEYELDSRLVDMRIIDDVFECEKKFKVQFIKHLRPDTVRITNTYQKMKQKHPIELFSSTTAECIERFLEAPQLKNYNKKDEAKTFAFFCRFIEQWWLIVSNRDDKDYEIRLNNQHYRFLANVSNVFDNIRLFDQKSGQTKDSYHPTQKSFIILNTSLNLLVRHLTEEDDENISLAGGQISSDYIEMQFSVIKRRNPRPDARHISGGVKRASLGAAASSNGNVLNRKTTTIIDPVTLLRASKSVSKGCFNFDKDKPERKFELMMFDLLPDVGGSWSSKCDDCYKSIQFAQINEPLRLILVETERLIELNYYRFLDGSVDLFINQLILFLRVDAKSRQFDCRRHSSEFVKSLMRKYVIARLQSNTFKGRPDYESVFGSKSFDDSVYHA